MDGDTIENHPDLMNCLATSKTEMLAVRRLRPRGTLGPEKGGMAALCHRHSGEELRDEVGALLIRPRPTRPGEAAREGFLCRRGSGWPPPQDEVGRGGGAKGLFRSRRVAGEERDEGSGCWGVVARGDHRASKRGARSGTPEAFCGTDSTELTSEARFELPIAAWLSAHFRMRSALLR
jgi:hypothetical protein